MTACLACMAATAAPASYSLLKGEVFGRDFEKALGVGLLITTDQVVIGFLAIAVPTSLLVLLRRARGRAWPIDVLAALTGAGLVLWCLLLGFGDRLTTGQTALLAAGLGAAGLAGGIATGTNLRRLSESCPPAGPGQWGQWIVLSLWRAPATVVTAGRSGGARPTRRGLLAAGAGLLAALMAAASGLAATRNDLLDRLQVLLAAAVVVLAVALGVLATGEPRRWRWRRVAMMGLLLAAGLLPASRGSGVQASLQRLRRFDPMGRAGLNVLEGRLAPRGSLCPGDYAPPTVGSGPPVRVSVMDALRDARPLTIVVIWDGARRDQMGLYGYRRTHAPFVSTTPNLDRRVDRFLRFRNAFSQGTTTTVSLRHLFTGRYSTRHMKARHGIGPFWTCQLAQAGYDAFHLNILAADVHGISTDAFLRDMPPAIRNRTEPLDCASCGEDDKQASWHALGNRKATPGLTAPGAGVTFIECNRQDERKAVRDLLAFLRTRRQTRGAGVFAFLHMDLTHSPWYVYPDAPPFGSDPPDRCDHGIYRSDRFLGELMDGLEAMGMWDQTVLVLAADHGQNPTGGGGAPSYDRVKVPLVMKLPGVEGRDIDEMAALIDVGPTLVEIHCPQALGGMEGRSLWPVILGRPGGPPRVLFGLEGMGPSFFAVTDRGMLYVHDPRDRAERLSNWRLDPGGSEDLLRVDRHAAAVARRYMDWFLNEHARGRNYTDPAYQHPDDPPDVRPAGFHRPLWPHRSGSDDIPN